MPSHVIDSRIFKDMYGSAELRRVFSDEALVQSWLDYEAALARAEAAVGLIPTEAAEEISDKARVEFIDFESLKAGVDQTTHELVPLIWQLDKLCGGDAGGYVHWGATTQDVADTGLTLQIKAARAIIMRDLTALGDELAALAQRERDTLMAGRTHGQHALPITFGFKAAVWLDEVHRHVQRLEEIEPRLLVGEFAGAAGTLASLADKGMAVRTRLMAELGLYEPDIAWHAARDRFAEWVALLALIAGTMGRIAQEIILLQKSETAELEEPYQRGKIGSSTMPHKRNPMLCEGILAEARLVRGLVIPALNAQEAEHERDWTSMHLEWAVIPEASILAGGAVAHTLEAIRGLHVDRERMRQNLDLLHGLILSEAVMLRLGAYLGRQTAHEIVHDAAMIAFEQGRPLPDVLLEDERITRHLSPDEVRAMFRPEAYIGLAGEFVDRVVHHWRQRPSGA